MRIPFMDLPEAVGREDRLVRGCVALSLWLMGGYAIVASRGLTPVSVGFVLMGLYFALTAASGRDPVYSHYGIDTGPGPDDQTVPAGFLWEDAPEPVVDAHGPEAAADPDPEIRSLTGR